MDLAAARTVLGVSASDDWQTVRGRYRRLIRTAHPDVAGDVGADRAIRINAAYRTLAAAHRDGRLDEPDERTAPTVPSSPTPRRSRAAPGAVSSDVRIVGSDTIVLSSTPSETFRRLVDAVHSLGDISYIDRSAAILEAVLTLEDGHHASLVISLQGRAHDASCEAFCTLEALDRAEQLEVSGVVEQLVPLIPPDRAAPA